MILSEELIISASVEKRAGELSRMIRDDKVDKKGLWYAVTTGSKGMNLLFILSNLELQNRYYWTDDRRVLGLAGSWPEAVRIVESLFEEAQFLAQPVSGEERPLSAEEFWEYFSRR